MLKTISFTVAASEAAYNAGTDTWTIDETAAGYKLDNIFSIHQISVEGLATPGSNTFDVLIRPPGGSAFQEHVTAQTTIDTVTIEGVLANAIQVKCDQDQNAAATAKLIITSRSRGTI